MSRPLSLVAGLLNLVGGLAMFLICWPSVGLQVPADVAFRAVPVAGAMTVALAWHSGPARRVALYVNALCGPGMALFAAMHFESFLAGVATAVVGILPSVLALCLEPPSSRPPH